MFNPIKFIKEQYIILRNYHYEKKIREMYHPASMAWLYYKSHITFYENSRSNTKQIDETQFG